MKHPERFVGVHFLVQSINALVEIIPSEKTSKEVIGSVCKMVLKNKKVPIVVKNCPGFLVNRVLLPYVNEAIHLMIHGFKISDIDAIAEKFGMPIGPLALADEVGLDVGEKVLNVLQQGYGDRMAIPDMFSKIVHEDDLKGKVWQVLSI